ncbi:MAG: TROVE domain-containing protein, partial [bacterium]|nr:TROVE domain-containing protein [bacterium]
DGYYQKAGEQMKALTSVLSKVNPEFAAKAAVYARNEFGMRSITHVLAGEITKFASGKPWAKEFYSAIVRRPDDMTEIMAYYFGREGKKSALPNALKKGFKKAFGKFDAYQLAKYRGDKNEVSLVDVVNLVRPKGNDKNSKALAELVAGTLKSENTFESKLSAAGQGAKTAEEKAANKAQAWADLVMSGKIGQFALLRNLRNIVNDASTEVLDKACELLTTESRIRKSMILPFRYITALDEITVLTGAKAKKVQRALNTAVDISCANVPKFDGNTAVVIDLSGSMDSPVAGGKTKMNKVAALFGAMMAKANDADVLSFGNHATYLPVNVNDSVMGMANWIVSTNEGGYYGGNSGKYSVGHGTNFQDIFKKLKTKYDRVFLFSDMEAWMGYNTPKDEFAAYKRKYNAADCKVYAFNLHASGTLQFPERNVFALRGFSEKIFDVIDNLEIDKRALINTINNYVDFAKLAAKE